jgi:hypothetical protein
LNCSKFRAIEIGIEIEVLRISVESKISLKKLGIYPDIYPDTWYLPRV